MGTIGAPLRAIEDFITAQMAAGQTPGLALTILHHGEVVLQRGYGYADLATRTPMTERTGVVIGSTTKALTCAALLQLVERGLLNLDDPIQRYIPSFRVADAEASAHMTIRQAVTHNAGLPPSLSDDGAFLFTDYAGDDALARYIQDVLPTRRLLWAPGGGWVYANDGFVIAGRIIEILTGTTYEAYMHQHVFAPLGLEDTFFSHEHRPTTSVATPYDYDADGSPYPSFFAHNRASSAAGSQLIMSSRDAGRWLQALLHGGLGQQARVLTPESVAELTRPQVQVPNGIRSSDGADTWYALGWMIGPLADVSSISHGGSTITMGSQFLLLPAEELVVTVVSNSVSEVAAIVAKGVAHLLLGREPAARFPRVDRAIQPDRSLWSRLAGTYQAEIAQNSVPGPLPIEFDGTRLHARTYPGDSRRRPGDIWLFPVADLEFVLFGRGRTGSTSRFTIDGDAVHALWQDTPLVKVT